MKFLEDGSKFSMRKYLAFTVGLCWVAAHIVWFSSNADKELPYTYIGVDASVILFYFGKKFIEGVRLKNKD